jgi:hypothetical protein
MPTIVMDALANDLKPAIDAQRRLIARWSCSIKLLRYLLVQVPIGQPISDIPAHAQLNDVGVERAPAVDRVTGDRLRHSVSLHDRNPLIEYAPTSRKSCTKSYPEPVRRWCCDALAFRLATWVEGARSAKPYERSSSTPISRRIYEAYGWHAGNSLGEFHHGKHERR